MDLVNKSSANADPVVEKEGAGTEEAKIFTQAQVEELVKDRLSKQERKFLRKQDEIEKELEALKTPVKEKEVKQLTPLEVEYKTKLAEFENKTKALNEKLNKQKQMSLKSVIVQKLVENNCIDPEMVFNDLRSRELINLDEDDEITVPSMFKDVDECIKDYLTKKEYLVKAQRQGGIGSKPINGLNIEQLTEKQRLLQEYQAAQNKKSWLDRNRSK